MIEGRLQLDQWDDRESGQKRSKLKVVCENMTMIGGRSEGGQAPQSQPNDQKPSYAPPPGGDGFTDEDCPF